MHYALGFLASSLYWPGIAGAASTPRWAVLFVMVPWMLTPRRASAAHIIGALFIAWAAVSLAWSPATFDGMDAVFVLLLLAGCFCLGHQSENLRPVLVGAAIGLTLSSAITVAQWWGLQPVRSGSTLATGLFVNGNYMAEAAALVIVGVMAERLWWLLPGLLPALLLPHARGAVLAVVIAAAVLFRAKPDVVIALGGAVLLAALWSVLHIDATTLDRLEMWSATAQNVTFFGRGIGSFWTLYPDFDMHEVVTESPNHPHNELLNIAFELGAPGLLLALAFCVTMAGPIDTSRLILIALAVESCFAFPTHTPTTAFLGAVAAGHAVRNRYLLRDRVMRGRGIIPSRVAMPGLWARARTAQAGGASNAVPASLSRGAIRAGAQP